MLNTIRDERGNGYSPLAVSLHRGASLADGRVQLEELAADRDGVTTQKFQVEQRLYARGASGTCAYIIAAGIVRFERTTVTGTRRIIRLAGPGDLIGQEALLQQRYRDDAVACTPVGLRRVSTTLLDESGGHEARISLALMRRWQDTLDESEFWSTEMTSGPVRLRMLQLLARLHRHRDASERIWLPKRDQMGDMLNMALETCSRTLTALRREGVVAILPPRHAQVDWRLLMQALQQSEQ